MKRDQPKRLLAWMGALADPTRLRLLRLLEAHELGVVELCDVVQLPQSTVSRHLKILLDDRWLRTRRQGRTHLYRMTVADLPEGARRLWQLARAQTADWAALAHDQLRLHHRLDRRDRQAQAFFAGAAGRWDKLRGELYGDAFTEAALLSLLDGDWTVADLGCGTGQLAERLSPYVKQIVAVDNSEAMLSAARRRTSGLGNVRLRQGELDALPIGGASVDAALMVLVMSYLSRPTEGLGEARRILKPGGRLVIVDLLAHDRTDFARQMGQEALGFDPPALADLLGTVGFVDPRFRPLPPQTNAKGPALFAMVVRTS